MVNFGKLLVPVKRSPWVPEVDFEKALQTMKFKQWVENFNTK
jgi:hypothetical protein